MYAKTLKLWHQYGFVITIFGYVFMLGTIWQYHKDALASTDKAVTAIEAQHDKENADNRITKLEQIAIDNRDSMQDIKSWLGKISEKLDRR